MIDKMLSAMLFSCPALVLHDRGDEHAATPHSTESRKILLTQIFYAPPALVPSTQENALLSDHQTVFAAVPHHKPA